MLHYGYRDFIVAKGSHLDTSATKKPTRWWVWPMAYDETTGPVDTPDHRHPGFATKRAAMSAIDEFHNMQNAREN